jgi:hypothetical protein
MAQNCRAASLPIAAQRTSEPAAHTDAVKTAGEPREEDYQIGGHLQIALPIQRLCSDGTTSPPLPTHEIGDPNEEGDRGYHEADKPDDLDRTRIGERKNRILDHARPPGQPK